MVRNRKILKQKKAVVLVVAYSLLTSLFALSGSHVNQVTQESVDIRRHMNVQQAFWAAEAGVSQSLYGLNNSDWAGWSGVSSIKTNNERLSMGEYDVVVAGIGTKIAAVEVTGYSPFKGANGVMTKKLRVLLRKKSPFEFAAFGKYDLDISSNAHSDSYHSSKGEYDPGNNQRYNGHVGTNGVSMTIENRGYVYGNARVAPSGEIIVLNNAGYAGDDTYDCNHYLPPVIVPDDAKNASSGGTLHVGNGDRITLTAGSYKYDRIEVSGNGELIIEDGVTLYSQGDFNVTGTGEVFVNGTTELYVDGGIVIWGNGIANTTKTPADLMIYGSGSGQDIELSGNADLYAAIYAPEADVTVDGNGDVYGAIVGGDVNLVGGGWVHYDEDLFQLDMSGLNYAVYFWKEL